MKERVKSWGKGDEKTWESLNIWKKTLEHVGEILGETTNVCPMIFPVLCQYRTRKLL